MSDEVQTVPAAATSGKPWYVTLQDEIPVVCLTGIAVAAMFAMNAVDAKDLTIAAVAGITGWMAKSK